MEKPDIAQTIENEGIELKGNNHLLWCCCPFHDDKSPSMKVDTERQDFYCFGCRAYGDVIDFIRMFHKLSFKEALVYLDIEPGVKTRDESKLLSLKLKKEFNRWQEKRKRDLGDLYRVITRTLRGCNTFDEVCRYSGAIHWLSSIECELDVLMNGTDEEKFYLFKGAVSDEQ